jgi:DNA-binding XRE family transcriptional regulator
MCELFGMTEHTSIASLRKELGLTLDEFALAVGISSKGYVSQIERGVIDCSLSIALKIEEFSQGRVDAAMLSRDVRMARASCPGGCPIEYLAEAVPSPGSCGDFSPVSVGAASRAGADGVASPLNATPEGLEGLEAAE